MSTIERTNHATFVQRVSVVLEEIEYVEALGDRLPRGNNAARRAARVVGYHLAYVYNPSMRFWNLNGFDSSQHVQQQLKDGSWSEGTWKRIPYLEQAPVARRYAPDLTPEVTW